MDRQVHLRTQVVWCLLVLLLWALASPLAAQATSTTGPRSDPQSVGSPRASDSVVGVLTLAIADAPSSRTLGAVRQGSGVAIGPDGLVLTIGYLVLEADQVLLLTDDGRQIPARVMGYDVATGFGLVKALIPLALPPAPLGDPSRLDDTEPLLFITGGPHARITMARQIVQRPFSGYWEYHIDHAVFTAPARADHSGAALFNLRGELLGIGSLIVSDALGPDEPPMPGNMFVPVDLLKPILGELVAQGRSSQSKRAWMGAQCVEMSGEVRVARVSGASPAEAAGLQPGDRIVRIDGQRVEGLQGLWQHLWSGGAPEREVKLDILRDGRSQTVSLHTIDRQVAIRQPEGI